MRSCSSTESSPAARTGAEPRRRRRGLRADVDRRRARRIDHVEKIVALVVDHDECGKVAHFDLPHGFHTELGVLEHINFGDAVLG